MVLSSNGHNPLVPAILRHQPDQPGPHQRTIDRIRDDLVQAAPAIRARRTAIPASVDRSVATLALLGCDMLRLLGEIQARITHNPNTRALALMVEYRVRGAQSSLRMALEHQGLHQVAGNEVRTAHQELCRALSTLNRLDREARQ